MQYNIITSKKTLTHILIMEYTLYERVVFMATKSISKSVKISNEKEGRSLLSAIEDSRKCSNKSAEPLAAPQRVEKKDIKEFLEKTVQ